MYRSSRLDPADFDKAMRYAAVLLAQPHAAQPDPPKNSPSFSQPDPPSGPCPKSPFCPRTHTHARACTHARTCCAWLLHAKRKMIRQRGRSSMALLPCVVRCALVYRADRAVWDILSRGIPFRVTILVSGAGRQVRGAAEAALRQ